MPDPGVRPAVVAQLYAAGDESVPNPPATPRMVVYGTPPSPWPGALAYAFDQSTPSDGGMGFGVPGTEWRINPNGLDGPYSWDNARSMYSLAKGFWKRDLLSLLLTLSGDSVEWAVWQVPAPGSWWAPAVPYGEDGMGLYAIRVGVHATLGTYEELLHTFHLVKVRNGTDMSELDSSALDTLIGTLKTQWATFMNTASGNGLTAAPKACLATDIVYNEMRASLIEYNTAPTKPTVHVPTRFSAFSPTITGTASGNPLPYSTAYVATLLSTTKDRSKRGRVFFGGLAASQMSSGTTGQFQDAIHNLAIGLGYNWIAPISSTTDYDVCVVSSRGHAGHNSGGTATAPGAIGVGGVSSGLVPDTQRSRRKNVPEGRTLKWGSLPTM